MSDIEADESVEQEDDSFPELPPTQDLTAQWVRRSIRRILKSLTQDVIAWQPQLSAVPRGSDFDLQGAEGHGPVLDRLRATADVLGNVLAEGKAGDAVQSGLSYLAEPCSALSRGRASHQSDALQAAFAKQYRAELDNMGAELGRLPAHLRRLSEIAGKGAADCDPKSARRIHDRMRTLGDVTLRQIEEALVAAVTREERRELVMLRDEMKDWMAQRNVRVEETGAAIDELTVRGRALQNEGLIQSNRLAKAADLAGECAKPDGTGRHTSQVSAEAGLFAARMRALLLGARIDATAALQGTGSD